MGALDKQNAGEKTHTTMTGNTKGAAHQAARDLVFKGKEQTQRLHRAPAARLATEGQAQVRRFTAAQSLLFW